jgi:hypothetical protein
MLLPNQAKIHLGIKDGSILRLTKSHQPLCKKVG